MYLRYAIFYLQRYNLKRNTYLEQSYIQHQQ